MQVKYAAGIVKNRVTADRPVTCAIEHVGSVPSSLRFPSGIPMAPYCFSIPPIRQPSSSLRGKFVAHASIALSLDRCSFLFAMCVWKGGKQEANREREREEGFALPTILARIGHNTRSASRPLPRSRFSTRRKGIRALSSL